MSISDLPPREGALLGRSFSVPLRSEAPADSKDIELKWLKGQLKGMELLLQQNADLEREVSRLAEELETATTAVIKRGYLHKWRDREISFASKWGLRYFTLQGSTLSYFGDAHEQRPRRTYDLSQCVVKTEGTKKNGMYHVFGVYILGEDYSPGNKSMANQTQPGSQNLLLRLSSESQTDASQWCDMLEQSCALGEYMLAVASEAAGLGKGSEKPMRKSSSAERFHEIIVGISGEAGGLGVDSYFPEDLPGEGDSGLAFPGIEGRFPEKVQVGSSDSPNHPGENHDLNPTLLRRVRSSNAMLRKIKSRQTISREILERRSNTSIFPIRGGGIVGPKPPPGSQPVGNPTQIPHNKEGKTFSMPKTVSGSKPMHTQSNPSPLSNDVRPGEQNYRGFFNLGVIILLLSHARLIIDSHIKYGFVPAWRGGLEETAKASHLRGAMWVVSKPGQSIIQWCLSIGTSYVLETLALYGYISEGWMLFANVVAGTVNIVLPTLWVWNSQAHPGACMTYLFQSVILWMKLISYAHANRDLRKAKREHDLGKAQGEAAAKAAGVPFKSEMDLGLLGIGGDLHGKDGIPVSPWENPLSSVSGVKDLKPPFLRYGQNINLPNLLWFCVAPTLTYQLNYPMADRTRWPHVLTLVIRISIVTGLILFAVEQYIKPTLWSSMEPLHNMDVGELFQTIIKLAIPNTYVWLL